MLNDGVNSDRTGKAESYIITTNKGLTKLSRAAWDGQSSSTQESAFFELQTCLTFKACKAELEEGSSYVERIDELLTVNVDLANQLFADQRHCRRHGTRKGPFVKSEILPDLRFYIIFNSQDSFLAMPDLD